jgi:hypothetical protein
MEIIIIIIIIIKALIDYEKAFDSVPHSWIEKSIERIGVNNKIVKFCKLSMEKWSTELQLKTNQELMQSRLIKINRGIFQGTHCRHFFSV